MTLKILYSLFSECLVHSNFKTIVQPISFILYFTSPKSEKDKRKQ